MTYFQRDLHEADGALGPWTESDAKFHLEIGCYRNACLI